jgi:hypothetical protein
LPFAPLLLDKSPSVDAQDEIKPEDAMRAIIRAFENHAIVMLGEVHGNKQEYEFLRSLVASPDFEDRVDDVVLEYGNSLYQDTVDRYVTGERVPIEEVQKAWRNTTAIGAPSPVYGWLYQAVLEANRKRSKGHRMRIVLGDVYVTWDQVKTREDLGPFVANRDPYYATVVKEQVISRHRHALLIMGFPHFLRSTAGPGFIEKELRAAGATTFMIVTGTNAVGQYDDLDKRFDFVDISFDCSTQRELDRPIAGFGANAVSGTWPAAPGGCFEQSWTRNCGSNPSLLATQFARPRGQSGDSQEGRARG